MAFDRSVLVFILVLFSDLREITLLRMLAFVMLMCFLKVSLESKVTPSILCDWVKAMFSCVISLALFAFLISSGRFG